MFGNDESEKGKRNEMIIFCEFIFYFFLKKLNNKTKKIIFTP